mgnify:CR=1 FL=1
MTLLDDDQGDFTDGVAEVTEEFAIVEELLADGSERGGLHVLGIIWIYPNRSSPTYETV